MEQFLALLATFDAYPDDVVAVPELLRGTAAFAASSGLCRPPGTTDLPPFPEGGLMVLGHNLDSVDNYAARRASGFSHGDEGPGVTTMSTWRGLYRLVERANVGRQTIFFTNVYVGLKKGSPVGRFTRHQAPNYRRWCREFLEHQYLAMRPRAVLVLGQPAWTELAAAIDQPPWPPGRLAPSGSAKLKVFGRDTIVVPAHHTSMQKRVIEDAAALGAAWHQL